MTGRPAVQSDQGLDVLVRLHGVSKHYDEIVAVEPLDLEINRGDFVAILGPSGCGKTTLLRMIAGFIEPTSGWIELAGVDVTRLGPENRPTNMVFQGYGLFPHMNVRQNVGYGLRIAGLPKAEQTERVARIIALVHLEELADRNPAALSGGQQQRVALARALVMEPQVLLLDEPLAALDLQLRKTMQEELRRIHGEIGGTFVFVTHDQGEALGLANRIAVMNQGRLVQSDSPEGIYSKPASRFVASFIGDANVLPGRRRGGRIRLDAGAEFDGAGDDSPIVVVVRPEALALGSSASVGDHSVTGKVIDRIYLGSFVRYKVELDTGQMVIVHDRELEHHDDIFPGAAVHVGWPTTQHRVLDE